MSRHHQVNLCHHGGPLGLETKGQAQNQAGCRATAYRSTGPYLDQRDPELRGKTDREDSWII